MEDKYNGEEVLCFVKRYFAEGFVRVSEWDGMVTLFSLLGNVFWKLRSKAEFNSGWKQIIPYTIFKDRDWIFAYERGSSGEGRLTSRVSIGVGGHINPCDVLAVEDVFAPAFMLRTYRNALMREINEELVIKEPSRDVTEYTPPVIGFINDNSNEVGRVHFGVVHQYDCSNMSIEPKEDCIQNGKFYSKERVLMNFWDRLEPWSRMILDAL